MGFQVNCCLAAAGSTWLFGFERGDSDAGETNAYLAA